jgi:hypothetical protein
MQPMHRKRPREPLETAKLTTGCITNCVISRAGALEMPSGRGEVGERVQIGRSHDVAPVVVLVAIAIVAVKLGRK